MSADETLFRLALTDLAPRVVDAYWHVGLRDPNAVRDIDAAGGITAIPVAGYLAVKIPEDHIVRHHRAGIQPGLVTWLRSIDVTDPIAQRRIVRKVGPTNVHNYLTAGVDDVDALEALHAHEIAPSVAGPFWLAKVTDPAEMLALLDDGVNPAMAYKAHEHGIVDRDDWRRLARHRLDSAEIDRYGFCGFDVDTMCALADAGIDAHSALTYVGAGYRSAAEMLDLAQRGITARAAHGFALLGMDRTAMLDHHAAGVDGTLAHGYDRTGLPGDEILAFVRAGISGFDYQGYRRCGVDDATTMDFLRRAGVTAGDANRYLSAGIATFAEMATLARHDIDASAVTAYRRHGVVDVDTMARFAHHRITPRSLDTYRRTRPGDDLDAIFTHHLTRKRRR